MKEFRCGDVVPGCTRVFHAATEQEIFSQVAEHARRDHHMAELPASLVDRVRSLILEAPAA